MSSTLRDYALTAIRVVLIAAGLLVAAAIVYGLATMPPAPPDSDGFVSGLAYLFGSIIFVLALGVAGLGVVLPSLVGADDPVGFGRGQRLLLKAAAVMVGGGFVLGLAFGLLTELQYGFFLWLLTILLAVLVVVVTVGWRLVELTVAAAARIVGGAT